MINSEMLKGTLKPIIIKLLNENDRMYGYEITRQVEKMTSGNIKLTYGALYPILHKLEKEGDVQTETEMVNNRARVYYKMTRKGKGMAAEKIKELEELVQTLSGLLNTKPGLKDVLFRTA